MLSTHYSLRATNVQVFAPFLLYDIPLVLTISRLTEVVLSNVLMENNIRFCRSAGLSYREEKSLCSWENKRKSAESLFLKEQHFSK